MNDSSFTPEQREELKEMMTDAIDCYFTRKGKTTKHLLITAATVIGSITVILVGIKTILGWLGFTYIAKP